MELKESLQGLDLNFCLRNVNTFFQDKELKIKETYGFIDILSPVLTKFIEDDLKNQFEEDFMDGVYCLLYMIMKYDSSILIVLADKLTQEFCIKELALYHQDPKTFFQAASLALMDNPLTYAMNIIIGFPLDNEVKLLIINGFKVAAHFMIKLQAEV